MAIVCLLLRRWYLNDGRAIMHTSRNQGKGEHQNWPAICDLSGRPSFAGREAAGSAIHRLEVFHLS